MSAYLNDTASDKLYRERIREMRDELERRGFGGGDGRLKRALMEAMAAWGHRTSAPARIT